MTTPHIRHYVRRPMRLSCTLILLAAPLGLVATAAAQPLPPELPTPPSSASSSSSSSVAVPPPLAPPPPPPWTPTPAITTPVATPQSTPSDAPTHVDDERESDHRRVVGHFGAAYYGQYDVPLGFTSTTRTSGSVPVQMIGLRYWWSRLRLDVAFGLGASSGSETSSDGQPTYDQPSVDAFALMVRLPYALFDGGHYTLFVGPELAFGHAGETAHAYPRTDAPTAPDTYHSGNHTAIGVRAGAEIHFGFIGIPQLSLDATLGLMADFTNGTTSAPDFNGVYVDQSFHHFAVQSTVGHQPWNIFISNVAAAYYF